MSEQRCSPISGRVERRKVKVKQKEEMDLLCGGKRDEFGKYVC